MRLLSFNLRRDARIDGTNRWRHRRDRVAATLRGVDIAGLQEAKWPMLRDLVYGAPPHRWAGVGRRDGHRDGEFVPVLWRPDRFDALDQGHFWLSRHPDQPGSKDHEGSVIRMATWVRLAERSSARRLFVLNTHLDHRVEVARVEGAMQIRQALDDLVEDEAVVVTGDLNATPEDEAYRVLTADDGHRVHLRDTHDLAPRREGPDSTFNGFTATRPGKRIDVILVSPAWTVTLYEVDDRSVDGRFASDHYPVEVEATLH